MGVRERKEREREARRRAILDATRGLLRERGFDGTTTKSIGERCELSEATVFWYFESKAAIFTALVFEGIEVMSRRFDEIMTSDRPPRDKLAAILMFFSELRASYPEYFQVFTFMAQPNGSLPIEDKLKTELARHSGQLFRRLAELVRQIADRPDARLRADMLWAACIGLAVLRDARTNLGLGAKVHPNKGDLDRAVQILIDDIVGPKPSKRGS